MEAELHVHELVRPWRRATLIASAIAGVELVLLLVAGAAIVAKPLARAVRHHAEQVALAPPAKARAERRRQLAPPPKPTHPRARTKVLVLNGNGRTGAAHAEAGRLRSLGYRIAGAADARRHDYATSVVMYRPGFRPEGVRLAKDLHIRVVGPLDGLKPSALDGGQLAVIVGAR
ncbi:MAG TPA: LytR C-terminal domain-containing protein [Gaiellaceae bacterium]|nr:LytR C-terminal domain-containing protein [Gaiellaceae bacterium]